MFRRPEPDVLELKRCAEALGEVDSELIRLISSVLRLQYQLQNARRAVRQALDSSHTGLRLIDGGKPP
jgi:hypothetical protein